MISKSSADFIEGLVKDAEAKGATLTSPYKREGNLIWPVLIDHVTPVRPPCCIPHKIMDALAVSLSSASGLCGEVDNGCMSGKTSTEKPGRPLQCS